MGSVRKTISLRLVGTVMLTVSLGAFVPLETASSLSWLDQFAAPLLEGNEAGDEKPFDRGVSPDAGLLENLRTIFYPATDQGTGGVIWRTIRVIGVGVLILFLVRAGARFVMDPHNPEEVKKSQLNLVYIILGAIVFFLATRILGTALDFGSVEGVTGSENSALQQVENNLVLLVLSLMKGIAFFMAIFFLFYYGYKMMNAFEREEKLQEGKKGVLNVIVALVFIKIIDYLYFIAQEENFKTQAIEFIVEASKFLGYLFGGVMVVVLLYAGYIYVTAMGSESRIKKATGIVKTVFVGVLIVMLFMLIVYQIFQDVLA